MGCDIHTTVERQLPDGSWEFVKLTPEAFDTRHYGLFGFLADVRNYSLVPNPWPPHGWPMNITLDSRAVLEVWEDCCGHSEHWLLLSKLLNYDYDQIFEDRRIGKPTTLREFLGEWYFKELERLRQLGDPDKLRIIMCFDN